MSKKVQSNEEYLVVHKSKAMYKIIISYKSDKLAYPDPLNGHFLRKDTDKELQVIASTGVEAITLALECLEDPSGVELVKIAQMYDVCDIVTKKAKENGLNSFSKNS